MKKLFPVGCLASCLIAGHSFAGSATWNSRPANNTWNSASNWTPATVPNGPADIATFARSKITDLLVTTDIEVNSVVFNGEINFEIGIAPNDLSFTISGTGITNHSQASQAFTTNPSTQVGVPGSRLIFTNSATASAPGGQVLLTNKGSDASNLDGGSTSFFNTSTAGYASIGNRSAPAFGLGESAGNTTFYDNASAANALVTNYGGSGSMASGGATHFTSSSSAGSAMFTNTIGTGGALGGGTYFTESSTAGAAHFDNLGFVNFSGSATAGDATFRNFGGQVSSATAGSVSFSDTSSAGNATFTCDGGLVSGAFGGQIAFTGGDGANSTIILSGGVVNGAAGGSLNFGLGGNAGNCTVMANDAQIGGASGGEIDFDFDSIGGTARMEVFGAGTLSLEAHDAPGISIGSLEGDGLVLLGVNNLTVGINNLSTTFSGVIQDNGSGGSLTKTGTGRLNLTNANTYTGGTTVNGGTLLVNNATGSGLGTGPVQALSGILGGSGIISGRVTMGTGRGTGVTLGPGANSIIPGTLAIGKQLAFKSDATYRVTVNSSTSTADQVITNGVRIIGAQIVLNELGTTALPTGTTFTVISNTSSKPISGTFANLPDGGTVAVGSNTFQANYEGGDGNDLTLTVVP